MNEQQTRKEILETLTELGKMCKDAILDLDTDTNNPLKIRYIQVDTDICSKWDNTLFKDTTTRKWIMFTYNTIRALLCNKYKSDNLSIFYDRKRLKLVYSVNGLNITTIL